MNEATLASHLHRTDIPDVDLFIRTSGEQRSSNFMLWQAAYAEYVFQDKLWPDYDRRDLWAACEEYAERNRRFGRPSSRGSSARAAGDLSVNRWLRGAARVGSRPKTRP